MTERQFWNKLRKSCYHAAGTSVHLARLEPYALPGIPDVNGCYDGIDFWVELKVLKKGGFQQRLTRDQAVWLHRRHRAGGLTWIAALDELNEVWFWSGDQATHLTGQKYVLREPNAVVPIAHGATLLDVLSAQHVEMPNDV